MAQRSYETNAGEKRTVFEVTAQEVGPSLKWAVAKVEKTASKPSGFNAGGSKPKEEPDPWGSAPAIGDDTEPPF